MRTDSLFYLLFQLFPGLALELLGQDPSLAYEFRAEELKQTAFRLDGLLIPSDPSTNAPLYFIEVQFQHDPNFYGRLLAEVFLYLYRHPPAPRWQALVIYPDRRTESEAGPSYQPFLEMGWVQRVYLAELDPAPNAFGLQVLKLIVEPESQAPEQAQRLWQAIQTELIPAVEKGHWLELISAILAEKLRNLTWEEIQAMLIIPEPFKETRFYQDLVAIGRQEGIQQGIQQGIETELRLIVQRLHRKGQTPAQIAELLEIPLEQVEQFLQDATS